MAEDSIDPQQHRGTGGAVASSSSSSSASDVTPTRGASAGSAGSAGFSWSTISAAGVSDPINASKATIRRQLRKRLSELSEPQRHAKSVTACSLIAASPEFAAARAVMLSLPMPLEVDTTSLALKCWQAGKTVAVPKVSWDQRRMLPVEITGLQQSSFTTTGPG